MPGKGLPKILYLSDVPVELSSAGATLLYRLLQHYPKDKLYIIQGVGMDNKRPRVEGVKYHVSRSKLERLRFTRFAKYTKALSLASELSRSGKAKKIIHDFQPDIILTVGITLMWLNAYKLSKKYNIPLYVILHDDWLTTENHGKWHKYLAGMFGKMYRHAAERFCISPAMEKYYAELYGVHGKVIYPLRGREDISFPVVENKRGKKGLKFCYAGSLFTGDFAEMLDTVSYHIGLNEGELHIFSYWNKEMLASYSNLAASHVVFHPFMLSTDLMRKMHEEMDVAVLLNSFQHEESFRYNFSSKLVDYISAGLPVLFWGPASSGSIAWVIGKGYDAVLTEKDADKIALLIKSFNDDNRRKNWARKINKDGMEQFGFEANYNVFIENIQPGT